LAQRIDFSQNSAVYDRRHGAVLGDDEVDRLCTVAALPTHAAVLDIGAGTGRIAIPLAERGCEVVALEPAPGMVDQLRAKSSSHNLSVVIGEGAQLPFASHAFEAIVIARLLYLTTDWRQILRESSRVLAVGGFLFHEWGNGHVDEEWVQVREEARRLFEQAGVHQPFHPGVRSELDVDRELRTLGFVRLSDVVLGPGPQLTLREFLRRLLDGELSYIWNVPKTVLAECLPRLAAWSEEAFDLERPIAMPRRIYWTIFRSEAGLPSV
jgi:SAM-dependent methyltransferase